jgi:hypothetical protein
MWLGLCIANDTNQIKNRWPTARKFCVVRLYRYAFTDHHYLFQIASSWDCSAYQSRFINVSKDLVEVVLIHHFEELVAIGIININAHTISKLRANDSLSFHSRVATRPEMLAKRSLLHVTGGGLGKFVFRNSTCLGTLKSVKDFRQ